MEQVHEFSRTRRRRRRSSLGFAELCPKAIFVYEGRRMPLKIGIYGDLAARVTGSITPDELKLALRSYTRNIGYLQAMAWGGGTAHRP